MVWASIPLLINLLSCQRAGGIEESIYPLYGMGANHKLTIASELQKEVVIVPATITQEDIACLAAALHADLDKTADGKWRIHRKPSTMKALSYDDANWLWREAKSAADQAMSILNRRGGDAPDEAYKVLLSARDRYEKSDKVTIDRSGSEAQEATPAGRLLAELLNGMTQKQIEAATPGTTLCLCSNPVGDERLLEGWQDSFKRYMASEEKFANWADQARESGLISEGDRWVFPRKPFQKGERTLLLKINRQSEKPEFWLSIYFPDGSTEAFTLITPDGFVDPVPTVVKTLGSVELSDIELQQIERDKPDNKGFRASYLDPLVYEPLDGLVKESLCRYAKAMGANKLIADVPDRLALTLRSCLNGNILNLDSVAYQLAKWQCEVQIIGGIMVIRPKLPLQVEALRIDRRPLSTMYRRAAENSFGVDELFKLHDAYAESYSRSPFLEGLVSRIANMFGLSETANWQLPHEVLAILGSLNDNEVNNLRNGGSVRLSADRYPLPMHLLSDLVTRSNLFSGLSNEPSRLLSAFPSAVIVAPVRRLTRVKRLSKRYMVKTVIDTSTGESHVEQGIGVPIDDAFTSLRDLKIDPSNEKDLLKLDQDYTFLWQQELNQRVYITFGPSYKLGPYDIRVLVGEGKQPVSLRDVPGLFP